jgi:putative ABC transport system substrate-binding protein
MRRREFISLLGGAAAAWPLAARAQQGERMRLVGVLMTIAQDSPDAQARVGAFREGLHKLRWTPGRNIQIEYRWSAADPDRLGKDAAELVALAPDVIMAGTTPAVTSLQRASRTLPIVFASVIDPVGSGLVASLSRPAGNATGFVTFEYPLAGKWLELLKEVAPRVTRAAVLREPAVAAGIGQFAAIQSVGAIGMDLSVIDLRDLREVEQALAEFARGPNGGLIVTGSIFASSHRDTIIALAARHKLLAVYPYRYYVAAGGLISYGPDPVDEYRRAASYVDRILKGEKPADLPVQAPTKYELVINLKTAKALGLDIPPTLLARADEVIE